MSLSDRLKAYNDSLTSETMEVPEWGDGTSPLVIHYWPMTVAEMRRVYKLAAKEDLTALIEAILLRAKTESGDLLFSLKDKPELLKSPRDLIERIALPLMPKSDEAEEAGND